MVSIADLDPFLRVSLMGFALILTVLTGAAASRVRSVKLLLVTLGFLVFTVKGLLLSLGLFLEGLRATFAVSPELLLLDFAILVLLYAGTVKGA